MNADYDQIDFKLLYRRIKSLYLMPSKNLHFFRSFLKLKPLDKHCTR